MILTQLVRRSVRPENASQLPTKRLAEGDDTLHCHPLHRGETVQQHLLDKDEFIMADFREAVVKICIFIAFWPLFLLVDLVKHWMFKLKQIDVISHVNDAFWDYQTKVFHAHKVTREGNTRRLEFMLNHGVHKDNEELIFTAIEHSQLDCVKLLCDKGADLHFENVDHLPPLLFAVQRGNDRAVTTLLDSEPALLPQRDSLFHRCALHFCADEYKVDVDMINLLVSRGADINDAPELLLMAAIAQDENCIDAIRCILECKPSLATLNVAFTVPGTHTKTVNVLHLLAKRGNVRALKLMLQHPVDIHVKNEEGLNALDVAFEESIGHLERLTLNDQYSKTVEVLATAGLQLSKLPKIRTDYEKSIRDISLQHLSRLRIRAQLLTCNDENLFLTIPKIPLPPGGIADFIRSYLMYFENIHS